MQIICRHLLDTCLNMKKKLFSAIEQTHFKQRLKLDWVYCVRRGRHIMTLNISQKIWLLSQQFRGAKSHTDANTKKTRRHDWIILFIHLIISFCFDLHFQNTVSWMKVFFFNSASVSAAVHLQRLYVLQKRIIRIICGVHPRTHTEPLFFFYKTLNILNVDQIRDYSIALFMYKLTNCMLAFMFENMFIQTSDVYNYSTRYADLLCIQFASTKRTQRTIKHFGAKLWNSLCNVLDIDCAISIFKQRLKSFSCHDNIFSLNFLCHHFFPKCYCHFFYTFLNSVPPCTYSTSFLLTRSLMNLLSTST